jgi:hypothetical protein
MIETRSQTAPQRQGNGGDLDATERREGSAASRLDNVTGATEPADLASNTTGEKAQGSDR